MVTDGPTVQMIKDILHLFTVLCSVQFVIPPPLGAGAIMFFGLSFRPSEAWNTLFPLVHDSVGPSDQPWPFCGMSVRPSVCLSVGPYSHHNTFVFFSKTSVRPERFLGISLENAWREWHEILHADISCLPSELIGLWSRSVDFPPFGATLTWKQVKFGMHRNKPNIIYLQVKFGVSRHFWENAWREWPEIVHADVSSPPSELVMISSIF